MFNLGWSELLVIGVITVIVVGPKEMPRVVRAISNTFSKMRNMAGEFRDNMNEIADTEDYQEIMDELKKNNDQLEKTVAQANKKIAKIVKGDGKKSKSKKSKK